MKKLLYSLLAVSIIFTSCEEDEKGCTDPNAVNYDPSIEDTFENYDGSCCYDIVGSWSGSNTVIDSVYTVSYMEEIIDSLSSSGIREINFASWEWQSGNGIYYGPYYVTFLSDGTGSINYNEDNIYDTINYSINGNILMRKTSNHSEEGSFTYSINCQNLSLKVEEEMEWKEIVDFGDGPIEIDIHLLYSDELNFLRIFKSGPIQN